MEVNHQNNNNNWPNGLRMSNERIDLTQFEGITENRGAMNYEIDENGMVGNILGIEMNQKDAAAIYNIPRLISELKRCYEELDKWTEYATYVENVNMDCHQDASAEAGFLWKCTDCGAHFELPENGIYECEFGCDASE